MKGRALAGPHNFEQIPELAERGIARLGHFMADLDTRLGESKYVAGDSYSVADITALVVVDFAAMLLTLSYLTGAQRGWRWCPGG